MASLTSKNRVVCYSAFCVSFVSWQRYWARNTVDRWRMPLVGGGGRKTPKEGRYKQTLYDLENI